MMHKWLLVPIFIFIASVLYTCIKTDRCYRSAIKTCHSYNLWKKRGYKGKCVSEKEVEDLFKSLYPKHVFPSEMVKYDSGISRDVNLVTKFPIDHLQGELDIDTASNVGVLRESEDELIEKLVRAAEYRLSIIKDWRYWIEFIFFCPGKIMQVFSDINRNKSHYQSISMVMNIIYWIIDGLSIFASFK